MKVNLVILTFIVMHAALGRKVSILYGVACKMNLYLVLGLAMALDVFFTIFIYFLSEQAVSRLSFLRKIKERIISRQEKLTGSAVKLRRCFRPLGRIGIVMVTAIPFTGGINISIPLTHTLNLNKRESLLLLFAGNFLGCLIIILGIKGVLVWFS